MNKIWGWLKLCGGIAAIVFFLGLTHWVSPHLPGAAGKVYRQNGERQIEAGALLYTEVGPVREFLDERDGKYSLRLNLDGSIKLPEPEKNISEELPEAKSPEPRM